mmetsp:Transcript_72377/g.182593  ORF Transcript_72377/g.182593 Transcript_72377/m.182593 type:complete len:150 (+) Transcript_72377:524-973(+)
MLAVRPKPQPPAVIFPQSSNLSPRPLLQPTIVMIALSIGAKSGLPTGGLGVANSANVVVQRYHQLRQLDSIWPPQLHKFWAWRFFCVESGTRAVAQFCFGNPCAKSCRARFLTNVQPNKHLKRICFIPVAVCPVLSRLTFASKYNFDLV